MFEGQGQLLPLSQRNSLHPKLSMHTNLAQLAPVVALSAANLRATRESQ